MAGNKNSGRRPREASWGEERTTDGGTKEIIIRRPLKDKAPHPIVAKLEKALQDVDDMDVTDFIKTVFDAGADGLWVFRIVNGEEYKVGTLKPDMDLGDDGEALLLNKFGGPGTFVLKAAVRTAYGGLFRASKPKRVRIGLSDQQDAGSYAMPGTDADTIITRTLAREEKLHALNKIKELNAEPRGRSKEDDMRPDEVITIVNALKGSDKTSEILLEMLRTERERMSQMVSQQTAKNPLELLAPLAVPLFGFLDKKLSPGTVGKWIEMLRNPTEPVQESFWGGLRSLLSDFQPVLAPIMQKLGEQVAAAQVPGAPVARPSLTRPAMVPTAPQPPLTEDDMASRDYDDEDTKEVLDYVITCLDEHKFAEAWAALRTCEDTQDVIAPIVPGPEPMAFWFKLKEVDERMRTRKDVGLEFIGYIQKQIKDYIDAQQAAQAQAGEPEPTPPATPAA